MKNDIIRKLEAMIVHPDTPANERANAEIMLQAIREKYHEASLPAIASRSTNAVLMAENQEEDDGVGFHWFSGWYPKQK